MRFKIPQRHTPDTLVWGTAAKSPKHPVNTVAISDGLIRLADMAREDSPKGFWARDTLAHLTSTAVQQLANLTKRQPELWRPIAEDCFQWPVLLSPHPMFKKQAEGILRDLKVGAESGLRSDSKARWNTENDYAGYVAEALLTQLAVATLLLSEHPEHHAKLRGWQCDAIRLPGSFSADTWREWWAVARAFFLEAYPHSEEISELACIARQQLEPVKHHTPGRIRHRILYILESRFRSLAGRKR
jgi:hypothetical protein